MMNLLLKMMNFVLKMMDFVSAAGYPAAYFILNDRFFATFSPKTGAF